MIDKILGALLGFGVASAVSSKKYAKGGSTYAGGGEASFYERIREELIKGENFENDSADWYTLNNPKNNVRMIVIRGENKFYKNIDSYAKRVVQLLKRGY